MVLMSLTMATSAQAAEELETYTAEDVIVTATRIQENTDTVPAGVTVITAADIKKRQATSVREILQTEPGIYMSPTAETKDGLSMRGFSSSDILVLYDGQAISSSYDGSVSWDSLPINQIERIEIVRGAGSSLYGGRAVAGIINIIPKKAGKDTSIDMTMGYGSNHTLQQSLHVSGAVTDKLSFGAGYETRSTDGYRGYFRTAAGKATGSAAYSGALPKLSDGSYMIGGRGEKSKTSENYDINFNYQLDKARSLKYTYVHNAYDYSYNNPFSYISDSSGKPVFSGTVLTADGKYVTFKPSDFLGYLGERSSNIHKLTYQDDKNYIKASLGLNDIYKEGYSSASTAATSIGWNGAGSLSKYPSKNYTIDFQKTWKDLGRHTIVGGFAWEKSSMTQQLYNIKNWRDWSSIQSLSSKSEGSTKNLALFVQDEYALSADWKMYTGLRLDHYSKGGGYSYFSSTNSTKDYAGKDFTEVSPKIAFSYCPNAQTTYFTSYGHSFNPPALYKMYRTSSSSMSAVQANPDLRPETSDTFELGIKRSLDEKNTMGITYYDVTTKDKINYFSTNKIYDNIDQAKRRGIEFELQHTIDSDWKSYLNYAHETGKNTILGQEQTNYDIPKHLLHAGIEYTHKKWNWLLDAQYVSQRQTPDAVTGEYGSEDAFFLMSTSLNYKIEKDMTLQLGVQNLFDKHFFAAEAAAGRTYSLHINYHF